MKTLRLISSLAWALAIFSLENSSRAAERAGMAENLLWFDQPAAYFTESCPIANGRLAAMVFGGTADERIVLNESSLWSGSAQADFRPPDVYKELPEIQRLMLAGKVEEAEKRLTEKFLTLPERAEPVVVPANHAPGTGSVTFFGCYQILANLWLNFDLPDRIGITDYRRELDLSTSLARVSFKSGGVTFTREAVASVPDDIIVIRLMADQAGKISFRARLDRPERAATVADGQDGLLLSGQMQNGVDGHGNLFSARVRAVSKGGFTYTKDATLFVRGADEVLLYVTGLTSARTFAGRRADDPAKATKAEIDRAKSKPYAALVADQTNDHARYYDRMSFQLGGGDAAVQRKSTPQRIQAYARGANDPALVPLFFNFGRYALITTSRPGGLPPNLQGLWAEEIQTPWNGDWHLDINLEMNYWAADVCGLSDLNEPLFKLSENARAVGARTARQYYNADGWVTHAMTNPWGFSLPGWSSGWGVFQGATAWLCQHVWDQYDFTRDRAYLEKAYPILRDASRFYLDFLIPAPGTNYLVTVPSHSPENPYKLPNGKTVRAAVAATGDMQMIRYLFANTIAASEILGCDAELRAKLVAARARLVPTRIAPDDGRIMEWYEDFQDGDPQHRHMMHLWGAYPGKEITTEATPALVAAAKKTLEVRDAGSIPTRGMSGPAWGIVIRTGIWARFKDGEQCLKMVKALLRPTSPEVTSQRDESGVYPNLFAAGPPFQIEANLGAPAVIAEMFLQSHAGELNLLPALPREWAEGSIKGLRARGGYEVDLAWSGGRLTRAAIRRVAESAAPCRVRYGERVIELSLPTKGSAHLDAALNRTEG